MQATKPSWIEDAEYALDLVKFELLVGLTGVIPSATSNS